MKNFGKLCMLIVMYGGMTTAGAGNLNANTYELAKKSGSATPYVLEKDEIAMIGNKRAALPQENSAKELFRHSSYTLFSIKGKAVVKPMESKGAVEEKAGWVFYKYGEKDSAHRYITTGTILVTFEKNREIDMEGFALKNHLKYIKTVSTVNRQIILFSNMSDKNDVEAASSLVKRSDVAAAKPNWILPLKLF